MTTNQAAQAAFINMGEKMQTDYEKYRGKCKEYCEEVLKDKPELTLVRGYYHCPMWGKQEHWWLKDEKGNIIDPTVKQFPTKGIAAEYEEFNGICECAECGKEFKEEEGRFHGNYAFCSSRCFGHFVGVYGVY